MRKTLSTLACVGLSLLLLIPFMNHAPAAVDPAVTKVLVIVEENHSLSQMQTGMPYTFGLAKQYGYATNYTAITHPSLPNYIAIASGKTYGITDDNAPSSHKLTGASVFGQALANGKSAKTYAEGETSNCMLSNTGKYAVKHNPWAYFSDTAERSGCTKYDVPFTAIDGDITAGTLPNVGLVVPNLCNDAHDCSLATADAWVKALMPKVFAGADWKSGHLAVIITADEDDSKSGNKVLTTVIHPSVAQKVVSSSLTHYSLTRFLEDVAGASHLNAAATAPDMATAFGLVPSPGTITPTPTPTPTTTTPTPTPTVTTPTPTPTGTGTAATATLLADTFTEQDTATANYGTWPRFSVDATAGKVRHSYLRFNVTVPAGQQVASATLKAYSEAASAGVGVSVYKTDSTWTESGITWNNEPARGALVTSKAGYANGTYVPFDVTSAVPAAGGQIDLRLETTQATWMGFHSRDNTANLPPQLVVTLTPAPTPTPTPTPTVTNTPPADSAAVAFNWGPVISGDEFNYVGAPSSKWNLYNSAGQSGNGLRRPAAWNVDGSVATVTGDSSGTTGGMSANFGRQKYGRWEVRMKADRDPKYHAVAILWPDVKASTCPEIDYSELTGNLALAHFYLHYGCGGVQTTASQTLDTTQWHNYAVEWTATGVTGYIDGVAYFHDTNLAHLPPGSMHQTLQLDWFPDGTATRTSTMSVDWVRVYGF